MGQEKALLSAPPPAAPLPSLKEPRAVSTFGRKDVTYLVLFLLGCVPYLNTLRNGLVYDDLDQVLNNPFIINTHHLKQIFMTSVWTFKTAAPTVAYFRPLMNLTFLGLHEIYGSVAAGYHIFSVLLSGWIVCLVYAVTNRWTRNRPLALVASVIFALHPVHSEVVAWVSDITDLEVSFFVLLAFWCYLSLDQPRSRLWLRHLAVVGSFVLALLSKEIAVVLPPVALVFEHFYRDDRVQTPFLTKVGRYSPLWIALGLYFVYRHIVFGAVGALSLRHNLGIGQTILCGFQLFGHYLYKLFWPIKLQAFYVFTRSEHIWDPAVLAGIAAFILFLAVWLFFLRSQPVVSFGVVWYLAFLGLALNVRWLAAAAFAERYLFLPSLGFAWIAAVCVLALWRASVSRRAFLRPVFACAAAVLAILAFVRIYTRNRDWHDNQTLYERTLQQDPRAVYIRVNLAGYYWGDGQQQRAVQEWQRAHQDAPEFYPPLVNLGMAAIFNHNWDAAEKYLQEAAESSATASGPHYWLGILREKQGRLEEAEKELLHAEELSPYEASAYAELGHLYIRQGRMAEAVRQLYVSASQMNDPISWDDLGDLYLRIGQIENAEHAYLSALDANPYDSESHVGLGQIYEKRGDAARAEKEYKIALQKQANNPIALAGLARLQKTRSK